MRQTYRHEQSERRINRTYRSHATSFQVSDESISCHAHHGKQVRDHGTHSGRCGNSADSHSAIDHRHAWREGEVVSVVSLAKAEDRQVDGKAQGGVPGFLGSLHEGLYPRAVRHHCTS
jgi:hypothetical protein